MRGSEVGMQRRGLYQNTLPRESVFQSLEAGSSSSSLAFDGLTRPGRN